MQILIEIINEYGVSGKEGELLTLKVANLKP